MYIPEGQGSALDAPRIEEAPITEDEARKAYRELLADIIKGKFDGMGFDTARNIIDVCAYAAWHIEGFDGHEDDTQIYSLFDLATDKTTELLLKESQDIIKKA